MITITCIVISIILMVYIFRKNNIMLLILCLLLRCFIIFPLNCIMGFCGFVKNITNWFGEIIINSTKIINQGFQGASWFFDQVEGICNFSVFIIKKIEMMLIKNVNTNYLLTNQTPEDSNTLFGFLMVKFKND